MQYATATHPRSQYTETSHSFLAHITRIRKSRDRSRSNGYTGTRRHMFSNILPILVFLGKCSIVINVAICGKNLTRFRRYYSTSNVPNVRGSARIREKLPLNTSVVLLKMSKNINWEITRELVSRFPNVHFHKSLFAISLQKFLSESLNHLEKMYPGNGSGVTSSQQSNLDTNKSKDGTLMNDMKK